MSISTEEKDRYLRETAIVLAREGFQTGKTDTGKLRVLLDGAPLCEVTENGGITYRNEDINEPERVAAKDMVYEIVRNTAEYMRQMETAPFLKADGLEDGYKVLADFNGTVLAGVQSKHGVHFVTWDWAYGHTGVCHGHYFMENYGWTKYMIEQIITDYAAATLDFSAVIFRYFNPVGAHPSGLIGEAPNGAPNNLMPYITQVATGKRKQLSVFGADYDTPDGTCIRDYIHIMDIAAGHTAALPFCTSHKGVEVINLGTGMGHSVLELISAFENATGIHIPFQIVGRRAGDIPVCFASAEKAKVLLGWQATRSLQDMCRDAWNWQQKNPDGFI